MPQDTPNRVERRLSAILAADVAGYSRLMHHAEEATHSRLMALLVGVIEPAIAEHGGRIVKNTGDGFLTEFPSAVEAVRAAIQFQASTNELTSAEAEDNRIAFRVGVNIGDVIVEPHDIFGDGVNIAARLEGIAEPGGICISASVYDQVQGKVGVEFVDLGEQSLKNIARPVRVYAIARDGSSRAVTSSDSARTLSSPPRLSIVVLPFANLSDDPSQDYFVDGVTESLTTDLSRIGGSFVIGRHTAFTYKGKALGLRQVGRELNVRYALEGSVQRSASKLRVNVQLVDMEAGAHLWSDRFDKPIADLFDMQDEIVSRLANALNAELIEVEARQVGRSLHPDAMGLYFLGRHWWNKGFTSEYLAQARRCFEGALAIDPENVDAMIWIAAVDLTLGAALLTDDHRQCLARAETILLKVLSEAPNHAFAHLAMGAVLTYTRRAPQGIAECERALALDRNLADAHALIGIAKTYSDRSAEAEVHVNEALRLSPRDISAFRWLANVGFAKLQLAADLEAVNWFLRGVEANRNWPLTHFGLAATLAHLGKLDEAQAAAKTGFTFDPTFTIHRLMTFTHGRAARFADGLRMVGVPER
ncbi:adenylate cyclase [Bradyrhizobium sp. LTSPM299]|uniref:adenylate/guanylate cyclase domain-containing protein n=1 Tax=Bradyrhizobium sp. LTSPM299 TaxID=1619233 RepID=UPI0005CAEF95|nr:adenylate/guanylate cyclase domain-containing protein [Bradyrhizobium sp. LTSPM299]KJC60479.1 adenylate cyclase [Bradyrhizobium sp. LTSPM299]